MSLLSICIPTYNRAALLLETLKCIDNEVSEDVCSLIEVCISDNASTDDTELMVEKFKTISRLKIVFSKNKKNLGADKNYLNAVALATYDYCWLFGSDDLVVPGAVSTILSEIKRNQDCQVFICNRVECDFQMRRKSDRFWLSNDQDDAVFDFSNSEEISLFFNKARSLGAIFSYLSSIVVKRDAWNSAVVDEKFIGTAYVHVDILFSVLFHGAKLKYLKAQLVLCRGDNDSFGDKGFLNRALLDYRGYSMILEKYIRDPHIKEQFLAIMRFEHPVSDVFRRYAYSETLADKRRLFKEMCAYNYNYLLSFALFAISIPGFPGFAKNVMKALRRIIR